MGQRWNDKMKLFFRRVRAVNGIGAMLVLALGIFLLFDPDTVLLFVCRIIGAALLAYGIFLLGSYFLNRQADKGVLLSFMLLFGILFSAIGFFILIFPQTVLGFTTFLFALLLFLFAVADLVEMSSLKASEDTRWWICLVGAVVAIVLGFLILLNPFATAALAARVSGAALIYAGLSSLIFTIRTGVFLRRAENSGKEDDVIDGEASFSDDEEWK